MDTCPPDVGSPWLCAVRVIRAAPAHCCVTLPRGVKLWHGHPGGVMAGGWCPDASGAGFEGWGWVVWPLANPKRGNKWGNKSSYEKVKPSIHAGFKASFSRRQPHTRHRHTLETPVCGGFSLCLGVVWCPDIHTDFTSNSHGSSGCGNTRSDRVCIQGHLPRSHDTVHDGC